MKKKYLFSGMILLTLVLTTGTFAYTYAGAAGMTLDAAIAGEAIATCEPSAEQPVWEDILPDGEYDYDILLPCAPGDEAAIPFQSPDSGDHWDKVADMPADDWDTYVANAYHGWFKRDLYTLTDYTQAGGYETIRNVTVYFRVAGENGAAVRAAIKTYGTIFQGDVESLNGRGFVTMSHQWDKNPATRQEWTWDEVNELQAGVTLKGKKYGSAYCTQVYVTVEYEFVVIQGAVPRGDLFDITPHPEYTGDLLVKVYLTNTAELLKAYQYLNMKLYVEDSLEADKTPDYQVLSIETGVVLFNIEGGSAESYTVEVKGGSYRLISGNVDEWGEGWSIAPEFYCEVAQR